MTKLSKRGDHAMPGWVSHGPVQINVGRDLHIHHGGGAQHFDAPELGERSSAGPGFVFALGRVWAIAWTLIKAAAWLVVALLSLAAWLVFGAIALAVWLLGRVANVVLFVERKLGGAPTQFVYVPSILQRDGAQLRALESDYDSDIIDTESSTPATVLARRTQ